MSACFCSGGAQTPAPVGFQNHFIHIHHSGRIYDGYDPDRANPYQRCYGPRLLTNVLERLPAMTNRDDLEILLPSHWQSPAATRAILATCA